MYQQIKVSIIMPVYNSKKYLKDCVNSILTQSFQDFELLLIDDGSTDGSSEICDSLIAEDNRVKVFHKVNEGICSARNFGIERAIGEYIAFSDHDDKVLPGFLDDNYTFAKKNDADIIKFGREALIIKGEVTIKRDVRRFSKCIITRDNIPLQFLKYRFDGAMTCVWDGFYKRSFLEINKLKFDTIYKKGGEDIDFCSRSFVKAKTVVMNDGVYYCHNIRVGYSTSTKPDEQRLQKFRLLAENLNSCVKNLQIPYEKNAFYYMNIVKELVYPSMIYFRGIYASKLEVEKYMGSIENVIFECNPNFFEMIKISKKWGAYSGLFKKKRYSVMYYSLKLKC